MAHRFEDISQNFDRADGEVYVHWNKSEEDKFFFDNNERPYGIEGINMFGLRQVQPYLRQQGFSKVHFYLTDTEYTGVVRSEQVQGELHIYFE
ncbi:hypothetical protein [Vibrio gallicus]|uniref:hypothetical protein n=1 Tax=Vibrio gallicus TaxID=190897 RepID=UPI0021C287AB|nr:hypothetical protein [Vibrio gallicus]